MVAEESIIVSEIWKPDFDNFQFGDSPQNINTHLPRQFRTTQWNTLPQATEYKHDVRPNYDQVIEAYAKVFRCPMIETEYSNQFYHEDNETIYFSYQYSDQSHTLIQILRKDATTPIDDYGLDCLATYRQQRGESMQSFALTQ
ncbi:unnamed protein product [Adineta steineri]|uniref:Uncharacterized protein n=1 Tax=Adineta steineri TaxID=433720 RepID=A0A815B7J6_9BILA|nr:unnamed protein product [Adineta steineri]